MKKSAIFLFVLISLVVLFMLSCAVETAPTNNVGQPSEMVSERANTLIEHGDKIFSDVLEEYPIFNSNCDLSTDMKEYLDYVLFPSNWDGTKTFSERMKDVYWSDNNVAMILSQIDASLDETKSQPMIPAAYFFDRGKSDTERYQWYEWFANLFTFGWYDINKISNLEGQIDDLEAINRQLRKDLTATKEELANANNQLLNANHQLEYANNELDYTNNQLTDANQDLFGANQNLSWIGNDLYSQLQTTGYSIDSFRQALRGDLYKLNNKMDDQLTELGSLNNDVSVLRQDVLNLTNVAYLQDLKDPMARVDGFLSEYGMCVDLSDARLLADALIKEYGYINVRFIDCAKSLQSWAADSSPTGGHKYSALVPASHTVDPSSDVPVIYAKIQFDNSGDVDYYFDYTNPQKTINIGLGNLVYLSKMMMTRFTLNNILFWGNALKNTNKNVAQGYLDMLNSSGIKPSILAALTTMDNEYNGFKTHLHINFGDIYDSNHITKITYYKNGTQIGTTTTLTWEEIEDLVYESYAKSYMSYLGQIFKELITLEINLNAYIQ